MHMLLGPADSLDYSGLADQVRESMRNFNIDTHINIDLDLVREQADLAREQAREAVEQARSIDVDAIREQAREQSEMAREQAREAAEQFRDQIAASRDSWNGLAKGFNFAFAQQTPIAPMPPMPPMPAPKPYIVGQRRGGSIDSLYERGLSALDGRRYDQALDCFTEVATRGQAHADGALYWKAYTLNKLGRRDDANAALADLRKNYASSHWLDDAKALELEVKQSSGQRVSPESESTDELKLLALEGLVQSDPDRAYPILDKLLKGPQSPSLKKRAIYVLALSNSPRSQQLLEQIARGGGNPDLQMAAIQYLGRSGKDANKSVVLFEIYNASPDANVKRAVLRELASNRDKDHLMQIAKSDKSVEMRQESIRMLGGSTAGPEMWTLYQSETDPEVKRTILDYISGSTDRLIEVAKTEKDAKLRRSAIQRLGSVKATPATDALEQIYATEQDQQVKRAIIDAFAGQRNAKALVDVGRKESDIELKKTILRRLVDMRSADATPFLEEILK
jgi:hypothetical protein